MKLCLLDRLVFVSQNLSDLNINKDESSLSRSVNSSRSKTGKNAFKVTQVDVSDITQSQFEHQNLDVRNPRDTKVSSINYSNEKYDNSFLSVHMTHHYQQNSKNSPISISPTTTTTLPLTTSKSENNIFEKNISVNSSQFNVVSLSDLSVSSSTDDNNAVHPWNDLSKTQVLNKLSIEGVDDDDGKVENRF